MMLLCIVFILDKKFKAIGSIHSSHTSHTSARMKSVSSWNWNDVIQIAQKQQSRFPLHD